MADEKKNALKTKLVAQCTNCQRLIAVGETVTTPSDDEMNRGNVLCCDCVTPAKSKKESSA